MNIRNILKMDKVNLLVELFLLIIIVDGTYSDPECDCSSLSDRQEFIMIRLGKLESDNYQMKKRLRRLAVSKGSTRSNDEIVTKAPVVNVDQSVGKEIVTNMSKRIDTIESTLTKVMTILQLSAPKTVDTEDIANTSEQKHRLVKIESELDSVKNTMAQITHTNNLRKNLNDRCDTILKNTMREEKDIRVNFEFRVNENVKNLSDLCRNFTEKTGKVIDHFKAEILQKQEQFKEELNNEAIKINRSLNEHINETDSSIDNLQNDIMETKERLSSIKTTAVRDSTEKNPETTRKPGTTNVPVPAKKQPLLDRQLVCTHINVDGDILSYAANGEVGLYVFNSTLKHGENVFEIEILSIGEAGSMAVGVVGKDYYDNLPGLQDYGRGYHSDGKLYIRGYDNGNIGDKWKIGEKVRCTIASTSNGYIYVSFSHNGTWIFRSGSFHWGENYHFAVGMNGTQNKVKVILDS